MNEEILEALANGALAVTPLSHGNILLAGEDGNVVLARQCPRVRWRRHRRVLTAEEYEVLYVAAINALWPVQKTY